MTRWISTAEAWTHVAFYEREEARQKLNAKLYAGAIPTWAKFFTFKGKEYHDAEMPAEFWKFQTGPLLDYAKGTSRRIISGLAGIPNPKGPGYIVPRISDDRAEGVCLDVDALYSTWPKRTDEPKSVRHPHPGGRPPAADWLEIEKAVEAEIEKVGFPTRDGVPGWRYKADVVRFITPLLGTDEPGETALKKNVAAMLERIKAKRGGN
jgi:hypothetical protein